MLLFLLVLCKKKNYIIVFVIFNKCLCVTKKGVWHLKKINIVNHICVIKNDTLHFKNVHAFQKNWSWHFLNAYTMYKTVCVALKCFVPSENVKNIVEKSFKTFQNLYLKKMPIIHLKSIKHIFLNSPNIDVYWSI